MLDGYMRNLEKRGALQKLQDLKKKIFKFNSVQTKWTKPEKVLSKKESFLLYLLEARSYDNNGDTKIYNTQLQEILKVSKATVERYLKKLEHYGYIARFTIRQFAHKRGHPLSQRIIRCRRILLRSRFDVKSKKELKWKVDYRPPLKWSEGVYNETTGKPLHEKWIVPPGGGFRDATTGEKVTAAWNHIFELTNVKDGIIDDKGYDLYNLLFNRKQINPEDKLSTLIMGKNFAMGYN